MRSPRAAACACAAIVAAICFAVIFALPRDAFWIADNGNKALVAQRLVATQYRDFDFDQPGARFDPGGRYFPIDAPFRVLRDGKPSSVWLPAYPALAAPFYIVLGTPGLSVPAALSVAASAGLFVLWMAPVVGVVWAVFGGFALALATPLFFYGVTVWEHGVSVALTLGALLALSRPAPARFALAGFLIALGCAFRSEMALLGVALAIACWFARRRIVDPIWLALGALPAVAAILAFHLAAYGDPLGPHVTGSLLPVTGETQVSLRQWLRSAVALLTGYGSNGLEALAIAAFGAGAFAFGVLAALRDASGVRARICVALALAGWAFGLGRIVAADDPIAALNRYNGLSIQLPLVALAGCGFVCAWRDARFRSLRVALLGGAIFLGLGTVLGATTRLSSGIHWGPRFLLPAAPMIVALAIAASLRRSFGVLVVAGLVSSGAATWLLAQQLGESQRFGATLLAAPEPVVVTGHPLLAQQLAQIWERKPILLAQDPASMNALVQQLASRGAGAFALVVPPGGIRNAVPSGARCELRNENRGRHVGYFDLDVLACRIAPRRY